MGAQFQVRQTTNKAQVYQHLIKNTTIATIKTAQLRKDTPIMDIMWAIEKLTTTVEVEDQLQEAFIVTTTAYKHNHIFQTLRKNHCRISTGETKWLWNSFKNFQEFRGRMTIPTGSVETYQIKYKKCPRFQK